MKKLIGLLGILLMLTLLVPAQRADAFRGHGGYGWFLPGLIIGGALLGWGLAPRYYYSPPPPVYYPPSSGEVSQAPSSGSQLFIYPRQGQNQEKLISDRNECHNWAVSPIDYDPSKPASASLTEAQVAQKSADYYRAMGACLDARGYSLR